MSWFLEQWSTWLKDALGTIANIAAAWVAALAIYKAARTHGSTLLANVLRRQAVKDLTFAVERLERLSILQDSSSMSHAALLTHIFRCAVVTWFLIIAVNIGWPFSLPALIVFLSMAFTALRKNSDDVSAMAIPMTAFKARVKRIEDALRRCKETGAISDGALRDITNEIPTYTLETAVRLGHRIRELAEIAETPLSPKRLRDL